MISLRVKPEEEELIKEYAEQNGMSVSEFLRETALEKIKSEFVIVEAIVYTMEEFDKLLYKVSNGDIEISYDAKGWFYTLSENRQDDVTDEEIYSMLSEHYKIYNVKDIIVDTTKDKVVIVFN